MMNRLLGRIDDLTAMDQLSIDSQEDLFLLMVQVHLPMPRLSDEVAQSMVANLHAITA